MATDGPAAVLVAVGGEELLLGCRALACAPEADCEAVKGARGHNPTPFRAAAQDPLISPTAASNASPATHGPSPAASSPLSGGSSCSLPPTPHLREPELPAIMSSRADSACSVLSAPGLAAAAAAAPGPAAVTPVTAPSPPAPPSAELASGWFFNCRGCGCMTAYEQSFGGADVPFCRRCQALLTDAAPPMKAKMVATLLYVHQAWADAGL